MSVVLMRSERAVMEKRKATENMLANWRAPQYSLIYISPLTSCLGPSEPLASSSADPIHPPLQ